MFLVEKGYAELVKEGSVVALSEDSRRALALLSDIKEQLEERMSGGGFYLTDRTLKNILANSIYNLLSDEGSMIVAALYPGDR